MSIGQLSGWITTACKAACLSASLPASLAACLAATAAMGQIASGPDGSP